MNCSNCGRQNPPTALFCLDCGQKLREIGAPPQPAAATSAPVAPISPPVALPPAVNPGVAPPVIAPPEMVVAATPSAMSKCSRCGTDNPGTMRFCRMCGNTVANEGAKATPPPNVAPPAQVAIPKPSHSSCPRCAARVENAAAFCGVCGLSTTDMFPVTAAPVAHVDSPLHAAVKVAQPIVEMAAVSSPIATPIVASPIVVAPIARADQRDQPEPAGARVVTILKDGSEGQVYRISGGATDFGRSEGNIVLADDPYLSPRHARISFRDGQYFLKDLDSVNGIFSRIRDAVRLTDGDVLLLGQQVLRFELLSEHEGSFGPISHYGVMVFGTPEQPRIARLVQVTTEGIPRDVFHLSREETVLGRESGDIVFTDDAFLSRRHATFRIDRPTRSVILADLGSSNGTLIRFRGEREVRSGDTFRLGHHLFRFDTLSGAGGVSGR
ncbi:MAG: FHA domain-containing protein [Deltaproteobacteria bacterium]|nr:FHA domain-containing protein [Deltaproteobacteria bacterium]